jgi:HSF-type DNA-binding
MSHVPPEEGHVMLDDLQKMTFHEKLHRMLSHNDLSDYICWLPHGRAFRIVKSKRLEGNRIKILQELLGIENKSAFLKKLMNKGFKQLITAEKETNTFYNQVCSA